MTEKQESKTWDEIRKTGLFAFLLALPVMIWKSGKFGRALALISVSMFIFWFMGRLSDVVFTKFINRWEIRHESDKVLNRISVIKKSIDSVSGDVDRVDSYVKRESENRVNQIVSEYREKIAGLDSQIGDLEKSIDTFRDEQRAAVKERIISLRELVKIGKENIDSKKIRLEFEDLIKNINLLTVEEKERFMKDLKDMGFYVEEAGEEVSVYRGGRMFASSMDAVIVTPYRSGELLVSRDISYTGYEE